MIKELENLFRKKSKSSPLSRKSKEYNTARAVKSKIHRAYLNEANTALKREKYESPWETVQKASIIMETATLTPIEKQNKLQAIGAVSEWAAYYDLKAYPPQESYAENEELFISVPYLKASITLRAEMSVGVGIKDIKDNATDSETPYEKFINDTFDRLDIEKKLMKTQIHRDLYGNSYWWLKWEVNPETGIKELIDIVVIQPTRVRIRLDPDNSNKKIGYAYLPPVFNAAKVPQPVPLELSDVIHFKGEDYDDNPYAYSKVKGIKWILQARRDINILEPIIYKHYTKPWIHWKLKTEGLQDGQIGQYQSDLENTMLAAGPESDLITTDRWEAEVYSGSSAKDGNLVKSLTEDIDNQMFGEMKVPETYFKAKGTTDRMILRQDDNFMREMTRIQNYMNWILKEELIKPLLLNQFGDMSLDESNPDFNLPNIIWNEVLMENKFDTHSDERQDIQAGVLDINEVRKVRGLKEKEMSLIPGANPQNPIGGISPTTANPIPVTASKKKRQVIEEGSLKLIIEEK